MGHILGLYDAYYDNENDQDRCTENAETCVVEYAAGGRYYHNMMMDSYNGVGFLANDFEMMLKAYADSEYSYLDVEYYKTLDKDRKISKVIRNDWDEKTRY